MFEHLPHLLLLLPLCIFPFPCPFSILLAATISTKYGHMVPVRTLDTFLSLPCDILTNYLSTLSFQTTTRTRVQAFTIFRNLLNLIVYKRCPLARTRIGTSRTRHREYQSVFSPSFSSFRALPSLARLGPVLVEPLSTMRAVFLFLRLGTFDRGTSVHGMSFLFSHFSLTFEESSFFHLLVIRTTIPPSQPPSTLHHCTCGIDAIAIVEYIKESRE